MLGICIQGTLFVGWTAATIERVQSLLLGVRSPSIASLIFVIAFTLMEGYMLYIHTRNWKRGRNRVCGS